MIATLLADPSPRPQTAPQSSVRVGRPPLLEPPFDDERAADAETAPAALTSVHPITTGEPTRSSPPHAAGDLSGRPDSTSTRAAARYVRLCIEVLNGFRPAGHLRSLGGPVEFADIVRQLRYRRNGHAHFRTDPIGSGTNAGSRRGIHATTRPPSATNRPAGGAMGSGRSTSATNAAPLSAPVPSGPAAYALTRLRVSEPRDGVAEVVAVLSQAGTSIAMALRLERRGADWTCVLVQVI